MHQSVRDYWISFNDPLEGRVHWMYLDQKGWVSTGIGNKIDETRSPNTAPTAAERAGSLAEANELRWQESDSSPAAPDRIAAAWDAVKARLDLAPQGHLAFQPLTSLRVDDSEIDRHVFVKVDQMEAFLLNRVEFAGFATWPANAQLATLSMCWALGPAFGFPRFASHVAGREWGGAADECHFTPDVGTIQVRNALDRWHLLLAQTVEDQGLPLDRIAMELSDVFGVQGALLLLGYKAGRQDGVDGPTTRAAVRAFQSDNSLAENGAFDDPDTVGALGAALSSRGFTVN
ncbi:peptidoglycan-binding protein [Streptomyces sp. Go40/10]|uniref:peptidoglycan-binding domain-containing protein n=1 Tax=Streptomyces sp. Go40/10 TaxID=2825844 RepID=UPI001E39A2B8|nr:peptidoglycan-binding domain-containing protein [Streptomyces sp. Go40/10]UFR05969.1 peptidoglycan-binding protein [Streptomyces sp. Go40/10]